MTIAVPEEFVCPITFDVMTNPVRTNCVEEKPKKSTSLFSHIFTRNSDDSCSGHFFERNALAAHLRKNNNNCPSCNQIITKAIPDEDLADRITREFASKQPSHFQAAKTEVSLNYGNMKDLPIIPDAPATETPGFSNIGPSAEEEPRPYGESPVSAAFSHRAFDPYRLLYRARHPRRDSDITKDKKVSEHIRNDHLALAENEANTIISSYYRNKAYKNISESALNNYTSRSPEHLINARRVVSKIMDQKIKDDHYFKIVQKAFPNHLLHAEAISHLITDSRLKNKAFKITAYQNITLYTSSGNVALIKEVERIANTIVTDPSIKQSILNVATNAYIKKDKLKKAQNLNNSITSLSTQNQNTKNIAKGYINRNFSAGNFQKAVFTTSKIQSSVARDSAYGLIIEKAASNKAYLKSYKTISKISKSSKRLGLYIKVTSKMLFFGLFKAVSFPFKLSYWGFYYLLAPFRALFRRG